LVYYFLEPYRRSVCCKAILAVYCRHSVGRGGIETKHFRNHNDLVLQICGSMAKLFSMTNSKLDLRYSQQLVWSPANCYIQNDTSSDALSVIFRKEAPVAAWPSAPSRAMRMVSGAFQPFGTGAFQRGEPSYVPALPTLQALSMH